MPHEIEKRRRRFKLVEAVRVLMSAKCSSCGWGCTVQAPATDGIPAFEMMAFFGEANAHHAEDGHKVRVVEEFEHPPLLEASGTDSLIVDCIDKKAEAAKKILEG